MMYGEKQKLYYRHWCQIQLKTKADLVLKKHIILVFKLKTVVPLMVLFNELFSIVSFIESLKNSIYFKFKSLETLKDLNLPFDQFIISLLNKY